MQQINLRTIGPNLVTKLFIRPHFRDSIDNIQSFEDGDWFDFF